MTETEMKNLDFVCGLYGCESRNVKIKSNGPHNEIVCAFCERHVDYLKKEKNEGKRNCKNNSKFMNRHRLNGPLRCYWCGISEKVFKGGFECDHIIPIEDNGPDTFENTMPLCSACHWERNAHRHRTKNIGV